MKKNFFIRFYIIIISLLVIACNYDPESKKRATDEDEPQSSVTGTFFEAPVEISAGENPLNLLFIEVDNTTQKYLVVTNPAQQDGNSLVDDGTIQFFSHNPQASSTDTIFQLATEITPEDPSRRQHITFADFNNDGFKDIAVVESNPGEAQGEIVLLIGKSGLSFYEDNSTRTLVGEFPTYIVADDLDSDNFTDLAVVNRVGKTITMIYNEYGTGGGMVADPVSPGTGEYPIRVLTNKWDSDNLTDIAVLTDSEQLVEIWVNSTEKVFTKRHEISVGNGPQSMIKGDWDSDGDIDLAVTNITDGTLTLICNNDNATSFTTYDVAAGRGPRQFASADFNNDGIDDFIISNWFIVRTTATATLTGEMSLLLSNKDQGLKPCQDPLESVYTQYTFASNTSAMASPPETVIVHDVNEDNRLDLLIALPVRKTIAIFLGRDYTPPE